jgi:hypothetical protein
MVLGEMKSFVVKLRSLVERLFRVNRCGARQTKLGETMGLHDRLVVEKKSPRVQESKAEPIGIGEQVSVVLKRGKETTGIRIGDSTGQSVSADILEGDLVGWTIQGRSRQNEEGNYDVAKILVARLNQDGAKWGELECTRQVDARREEGVDCQARYDKSRLCIQITRAETDGRVWKTLAETGTSSAQLSADSAADALHEAIERKARKTTPEDRLQITLALDATETVSHAFGPVLRSFASRHGNWARELKFNGIWLVGPSVALTSRLDGPPEHAHNDLPPS